MTGRWSGLTEIKDVEESIIETGTGGETEASSGVAIRAVAADPVGGGTASAEFVIAAAAGAASADEEGAGNLDLAEVGVDLLFRRYFE